MSSSRIHVSFTGAPIAFEISTASEMKSVPPRRPNPPPMYMLCTSMRAGSKPVMRAAACRATGLHLRGRPNLATVRANAGRAVQRLHAGVRQVRRFIYRFNTLRSTCQTTCRVTLGSAGNTWLFRQFCHARANDGAGQRGIRTFVPGDVESLAALYRCPRVVSHHSDTV